MSQVIVWDDHTGTPTKVVDPTPDSGYRTNPAISADGGSVSFERQPHILGDDPATWTWDVWVWDLGPNQLVQVTDGERTGWSHSPSTSGDGKTIAFATGASAVVAHTGSSVVALWHRS